MDLSSSRGPQPSHPLAQFGATAPRRSAAAHPDEHKESGGGRIEHVRRRQKVNGGPEGDGDTASDPLRGLDAVALRKALLAHYDAHRREMPWRGERDPYRVWISEVMLQQTRVETVRERYAPFLATFPTVRALAGADEHRVLKAWEGLGYYRRARDLSRAAREVVAHHGGALPAEAAALRALPGFGPYTTAAVASIAHGLPEAAVDGNVLRVLARLLDEGGDVAKRPARARLEAAAASLLDHARPGDWNQALMDLGATVCVPRRPRCDACPWAASCRGLAAGREAFLPRRPRRRPLPHVDVAVGLVWRKDRVLVARRPAEGLLGGLWEFPGGKRGVGEAVARACEREIREETGLVVRALPPPFCVVEHAYSHFRVTLHVFHCRLLRGRLRARGIEAPRFARLADLSRLAFPRANVRVIALLREAAARGEAPPRATPARGRGSRPRRV